MTDLLSFKEPRHGVEWNSGRVDPDLAKVLLEAAGLAEPLGWSPLLVTCIYRSNVEDLAVGGTGHGPHTRWGAIDVRTIGVKQEYVRSVCSVINQRWEYDRDQPHLVVALLEGKDMPGTAPHLHLQTHRNTRLRDV